MKRRGKSGKLESERGLSMGNILEFDAVGIRVWQNVYFAPHPLLG
jgi:hypothetical protein